MKKLKVVIQLIHLKFMVIHSKIYVKTVETYNFYRITKIKKAKPLYMDTIECRHALYEYKNSLHEDDFYNRLACSILISTKEYVSDILEYNNINTDDDINKLTKCIKEIRNKLNII